MDFDALDPFALLSQRDIIPESVDDNYGNQTVTENPKLTGANSSSSQALATVHSFGQPNQIVHQQPDPNQPYVTHDFELLRNASGFNSFPILSADQQGSETSRPPFGGIEDEMEFIDGVIQTAWTKTVQPNIMHPAFFAQGAFDSSLMQATSNVAHFVDLNWSSYGRNPTIFVDPFGTLSQQELSATQISFHSDNGRIPNSNNARFLFSVH